MGRVEVYLTDENLARLKEICEIEEMGLAEYINDLLDKEIAKYDNPNSILYLLSKSLEQKKKYQIESDIKRLEGILSAESGE